MPYNHPEYAAWLQSWNAADRTLSERQRFARRVAAMWPDPSAVTDEDLSAFLGQPGLSVASRSTYYAHLRSLFGWLAKTGRIAEDPTDDLRRPTRPAPHPRPLSVAEARRAQQAATGDTFAMLMLGLLAGFRAHEAAKIHSRDVAQTGIHVVGKGRKEATLPTHPILWQLAQEREGYWFPGVERDHVSGHTVSNRITHLFASLGIEGSFHRCRHFYGTSLLRAGVNLRVVQELMRHASLATTAAYLGVDEDEKTAAILALAA